jgi:mannose/fructose/N-acetylgalactosamine-specific phosphotransferase system component IIC
MLTEKDKQFIIYWEQVRETESTFKHKFLAGLPVAFMFGLPILLFFGAVKIFFPSWFTTASHKANNVIVPGMTEKFMKVSSGDMIAAFIAVFIIILFFSFFRKHYKWENNEQLYQELKSKAKKEVTSPKY